MWKGKPSESLTKRLAFSSFPWDKRWESNAQDSPTKHFSKKQLTQFRWQCFFPNRPRCRGWSRRRSRRKGCSPREETLGFPEGLTMQHLQNMKYKKQLVIPNNITLESYSVLHSKTRKDKLGEKTAWRSNENTLTNDNFVWIRCVFCILNSISFIIIWCGLRPTAGKGSWKAAEGRDSPTMPWVLKTFTMIGKEIRATSIRTCIRRPGEKQIIPKMCATS